jgi:hypothetical protein
MSIASVATKGYGTWSTVNQLPTWGYGIGAAVLVQPVDGCIAQTNSRVAITETQNRVWIVSAK